MKKIFLILATLLSLLIIGAIITIRIIQGPGPEQAETTLRFKEITLDHTHKTDLNNSLPFMGLSAIDLDNDGTDEIFIGGGSGQADAIYRFSENAFHSIETDPGITKAENDITFGSAATDTTGNGYPDLFVARTSGIYYYTNQGNGTFQGTLIDFGLAENTTPLSIALGDINRDGFVDLYISGYIKNELIEGETNFSDTYGGYSHLLLNNGNNTWKDISKPAGVHRQHNTFLAMFIDLDNDKWPDLVVAQDTGVVETWRNNGDTTFTRKENPTIHSYPMGIGAGDLDNNGFTDLYFSNVGPTLPRALVRGNLTEEDGFNTDYMLLKNHGEFNFTDDAQKLNAATYGFGWGTTIADFDSDSRMDLYFAQNYARFPGVKFTSLYPGRLLQQFPDGTFKSVEKSAGLPNKNFGISQVISDFNRDGSPDIVLGNLTGPIRAFLTQGTGNHWLTLHLPDSPDWLNARATVELADGTKITRQLFASQGLCSDQSRALHFGLGSHTEIKSLTIDRIDGDTIYTEEVEIDSEFAIQESQES